MGERAPVLLAYRGGAGDGALRRVAWGVVLAGAVCLAASEGYATVVDVMRAQVMATPVQSQGAVANAFIKWCDIVGRVLQLP